MVVSMDATQVQGSRRAIGACDIEPVGLKRSDLRLLFRKCRGPSPNPKSQTTKSLEGMKVRGFRFWDCGVFFCRQGPEESEA